MQKEAEAVVHLLSDMVHIFFRLFIISYHQNIIILSSISVTSVQLCTYYCHSKSESTCEADLPTRCNFKS